MSHNTVRTISLPHGQALCLGDRTLVMGILNLTPDSFFDGGRYNLPERAVERAIEIREEGADILDVGAQSTRPGSHVLGPEEEMERLIPILPDLVRYAGIPVSVDTYYSRVAKEAVAAGAHIINDVSGLKVDEQIASVAAESGAGLILMHSRMQSDYRDLMAEVKEDLASSVALAREAGVPAERIILDPGIGFGKTVEQNLELIAKIEEIRAMGYPVLLGASRKSFIGRILDLPVEERLEGSLAAAVAGALLGADIVRVHDVRATVRAVRLVDEIKRHG